jgi:hypothetical protein
MIGQGVQRDIPLEASCNLADYGALTPYLGPIARPFAFFPQNAVAGPRPDQSLHAIANIGNIPIRQLVQQLPPPQQETWRRRLVSHFTVLPVSPAAQAPMGNA